MKKLKVTAWTVLIACGIIFLINACSKDEDGQSTINVSMIDAPGDFQQVNVEVIDVQLHTTSDGWQSIPVTDSIYDLLLLRDSANAALGTIVLPASKLSQIRLILGTQNTVMVDSVIHPLALSSQDETGLKLNVNQTLVAGAVYNLVIDFDADQSVHLLGNGTYKLKPVLSAAFQ